MVKFPYVLVIIIIIWILLATVYSIVRWTQRPKYGYIIPRVFILCSPRTVQFHYELILRVGLPSSDFNPEKHDIDLTVQGQQKNEVVPMTRLNTKTLLDEPLITNLSIVAYRLVEMPQLGGLILKHSGPFRSWIYAYDFTVIDLSTNREYYYTINQYIGSLNRVIPLEEPNREVEVHYPIDDIPLPQWTIEDTFLFIFTVVNCVMLSVTMMPINCTYGSDIGSVFLTVFGAVSLIIFLDWLIYYYIRWNQERKEFFNQTDSNCPCNLETMIRISVASFTLMIGATCLYFSVSVTEWRNSLVWLLVNLNSLTLAFGIWKMMQLMEVGDAIVYLGLRMRGVDDIYVGMRYSELVNDMHTKSNSASEDGNSSIALQGGVMRGLGPRSSVKSFGFDPVTGKSRLVGPKMSKVPHRGPQSVILRHSQVSLGAQNSGAPAEHSNSSRRRRLQDGATVKK